MIRPILLSLLCILAYSAVSAQPAQPKQTPQAGVCLISESTMICCEHSLAPLSDYLSDHLKLAEGSERLSSDDAIVLTTDPALPTEAFRLTVRERRIEITGGSYGGVFNGIQALFRLLPSEIYAKACSLPIELPCMEATDAPRFGYRGMMLDVARTWMNQDQVKRYIDLLSYHNINKLHLHLSDDEGWRIEIKSHPELTQIGGFRGGDSPIKAVYGKWDQKYGGFFTQDQMRELIAYAATRNIEIIPEIDLPGHSRNIASVHPAIRCNYPPDLVSTNGYDYRSAWCVAREENYALLGDILGEICDLFPSRYIHVGGDEVDVTQWEHCPDCRKLMEQRRMTKAIQLEDLFMERMAEILAAKGKLPAVWDEAANGALTREALAYGWQSVKSCLDATQKGYRTVVMPGEYFYFDMRQTPREDGHDWAAIFDAKKTYGFDPEKLGFTPEQMERVAGFAGTFFSEAYVSHEPEKPDYIDYMCFPRICALSRIAWNGNAEGWDAYYKELKSDHYDRMAAMGIRFRLFPPKLTWAGGALWATTDDGSDIWYVVDGLDAEHRYTRPLKVDSPHRYRFFTRYKTARSPYVADASHYRTITPAWKLSTSMGQSEKFPYKNAEAYKGLSRTRRACMVDDWLLYTFEEPVKCREMFLQTGNRQLPKTIVTTGFAEVSYDGKTFERAGDLQKGSITLQPERAVKAVRIVSGTTGNGTPYVTVQPPQVKPVL